MTDAGNVVYLGLSNVYVTMLLGKKVLMDIYVLFCINILLQ